MNTISKLILVLGVLLLASSSTYAKSEELLASWNDGKTKETIVQFVKEITTKGSDKFVAPVDRIATFDNDGTLWAEKPLYNHFLGVFAYMKKQMEADPSLAKREPYLSLVTKDKNYFANLMEDSAFNTLISQLIGVPFGGMTDKEFTAWARDFAKSFKHPKLKVGLKQTTYQPMQELIKYLEANGFTVYISTADEAKFVQAVSENIYGIPSQQVLGTAVRSDYINEKDGGSKFVRAYSTQYINNWAGKARLIQRTIGKRPVIAAGNSNGDQHMLQFAASTGGLALWLHHTDAKREFKYDGHTDKVAPLAKEGKIVEIDMKDDWKSVFVK